MTVARDYGPHHPIRVYTETIDLPSIAANTTEEESLTVTGVTTDDTVIAVIPASLEAGIMVGPARITAADTVAVTVVNATASAVDTASEAGWLFVVLKA